MFVSALRLTSVENVLENQLRSLVVEGRHSCQELEQTHAERPPVHHAVWQGAGGTKKQEGMRIERQAANIYILPVSVT